MVARRGLDLPVEGGAMSAPAPVSDRRDVAVGLALLALVVVVLGGGSVLARRLRSPVGTEPAATAPVSPAATAQGAGTGAPGGPVVVSQPSDIARLRTPLEREVAQAYLRYWDVYAEAMGTLDPGRLSEVT